MGLCRSTIRPFFLNSKIEQTFHVCVHVANDVTMYHTWKQCMEMVVRDSNLSGPYVYVCIRRVMEIFHGNIIRVRSITLPCMWQRPGNILLHDSKTLTRPCNAFRIWYFHNVLAQGIPFASTPHLLACVHSEKGRNCVQLQTSSTYSFFICVENKWIVHLNMQVAPETPKQTPRLCQVHLWMKTVRKLKWMLLVVVQRSEMPTFSSRGEGRFRR